MAVEIILLKDVEKLGRKGDSVNVREGFGRNYLLPRGFALPATRQNKARAETEKAHAAELKARRRTEAEEMVQRIASLSLRLEVPVGEKDKLFGSVTSKDLVEALAQKGISIDKKQLHLEKPIRTLGKHTVSLELEPEVKAHLQVEIVKNAKSGVKS